MLISNTLLIPDQFNEFSIGLDSVFYKLTANTINYGTKITLLLHLYLRNM